LKARPAHVRAPPEAKVTAKFALPTFFPWPTRHNSALRRSSAFHLQCSAAFCGSPRFAVTSPLSAKHPQNNSAKQFKTIHWHASPPGVLSRKPSTRVPIQVRSTNTKT